jgi:hypothetical protein
MSSQTKAKIRLLPIKTSPSLNRDIKTVHQKMLPPLKTGPKTKIDTMKKIQTSNLTQWAERTASENFELLKVVEGQEKRNRASMNFLEEVKAIVDLLQKALEGFQTSESGDSMARSALDEAFAVYNGNK